MRSRLLPAAIVAVVLALILGGAAIGAIRIPKGSVGYNKLSPGVQAKLDQIGDPGPQGPAGPVGAPGQPGVAGQAGAAGQAVGDEVLTYFAQVSDGEQTLKTMGPLTFTGACTPEGEDELSAVFSVSSAKDGVTISGTNLNAGDSLVLRKLTVAGDGSREEDSLPLIYAFDTGGFFLEGVPVTSVSFGEGCRFYGVLVRGG